MERYHHLSVSEREDIMCWRLEGISNAEIARRLGRSKSTIVREIKRNEFRKIYRASTAQKKYEIRRQKCVKQRKLDDPVIYAFVAMKFLGEQWSPEQIEGRLRLERSAISISDSTIYRGIASGRFDKLLPNHRKAKRKLRHRGKKRKSENLVERRGRTTAPAYIDERPAEAKERSAFGHWETDTVIGKRGGACIVTNVDRKSGFATGAKAARKTKEDVAYAMCASLVEHVTKTCTPDCGKEFACHDTVSEILGMQFFFAYPGCPWQRGSNENFNGLLREYFPKGKPIDPVPDWLIEQIFDKLNKRPRKRHGYRTPYEVYYSTELHLI